MSPRVTAVVGDHDNSCRQHAEAVASQWQKASGHRTVQAAPCSFVKHKLDEQDFARRSESIPWNGCYSDRRGAEVRGRQRDRPRVLLLMRLLLLLLLLLPSLLLLLLLLPLLLRLERRQARVTVLLRRVTRLGGPMRMLHDVPLLTRVGPPPCEGLLTVRRLHSDLLLRRPRGRVRVHRLLLRTVLNLLVQVPLGVMLRLICGRVVPAHRVLLMLRRHLLLLLLLQLGGRRHLLLTVGGRMLLTMPGGGVDQ